MHLCPPSGRLASEGRSGSRWWPRALRARGLCATNLPRRQIELRDSPSGVKQFRDPSTQVDDDAAHENKMSNARAHVETTKAAPRNPSARNPGQHLGDDNPV